MTGIEEILRRIAGVMDGLGIPYAIHGGIGLNYWGRPRATGDVDILVMVDEAGAGRLADYALEEGWEAVRELDNRLNIYFPGTRLYLEVWFARSDFERQVIERGVRKSFDGLDMVLASAEDVMVLKLLRFTALDKEDIVSIMDKQGERLDCRYVLRWSSRLRKTSGRLKDCIEETAYRDFWEACGKD
jgi:hypothetical protein